MAVANTFVAELTRSSLGNLFSCFYIWTHLDQLNIKLLKEANLCVIIPT